MKALTALSVLLVSGLLLAGCSTSPAGVYKLDTEAMKTSMKKDAEEKMKTATEAEKAGMNVGIQLGETMIDTLKDVTMELKADGKVEMKGGAMTSSGTYKNEGGKVTLEINGENRVFTYNGMKGTLTEDKAGDGFAIVFKKQ